MKQSKKKLVKNFSKTANNLNNFGQFKTLKGRVEKCKF